jgi:hypothetical protein
VIDKMLNKSRLWIGKTMDAKLLVPICSLSVASLSLLLAFSNRLRSRKALCCQISEPLLRADPKPFLDINFPDRDGRWAWTKTRFGLGLLKSLSSLDIIIANIGGSEIKATDFVEPIQFEIEFPCLFRVARVSVDQDTKKRLGVVADVEGDHKITVEPLTLNAGESFCLEVCVEDMARDSHWQIDPHIRALGTKIVIVRTDYMRSFYLTRKLALLMLIGSVAVAPLAKFNWIVPWLLFLELTGLAFFVFISICDHYFIDWLALLKKKFY